MNNKKQKLQHGDLVKVAIDNWPGMPVPVAAEYGMVIAEDEWENITIVLSNGKTVKQPSIFIEKITGDTNAL